jgi:hypothetical protein
MLRDLDHLAYDAKFSEVSNAITDGGSAEL